MSDRKRGKQGEGRAGEGQKGRRGEDTTSTEAEADERGDERRGRKTRAPALALSRRMKVELDFDVEPNWTTQRRDEVK